MATVAQRLAVGWFEREVGPLKSWLDVVDVGRGHDASVRFAGYADRLLGENQLAESSPARALVEPVSLGSLHVQIVLALSLVVGAVRAVP